MSVGAGDIVRADVRGIYNSTQACQNTYHLRNDGSAVDEADAVDDIVEILEALYVFLAALLKVLWVVQDVRIINITDQSDVGFGSFADPTPGTGVGTTTAPQVALGLILDTARLSSKGRKFFGPIENAAYGQNGVIVAGSLTALANVGDYMVVPQSATNSTWRFGIQSTKEGVGFLPFVGYGISPTAVTQRRRRVGVGI